MRRQLVPAGDFEFAVAELEQRYIGEDKRLCTCACGTSCTAQLLYMQGQGGGPCTGSSRLGGLGARFRLLIYAPA